MSNNNYAFKSLSLKKNMPYFFILGLFIGLIVAYIYHAYSSPTSEGLKPPMATKAPKKHF